MLRLCDFSNICVSLSLRQKPNQVHVRLFQTTNILKSQASPQKKDDKTHKIHLKNAARDFNNRRAAYNRQVSALRKEYAEMIAKQRAADKAEQDAIERELTRRRLERQRKKNVRSAQNAIRLKELREQREREFNEYLRIQKNLRDAKNERYTAARQLVIDELEEEAPLWLTTVEEVEKAFSHEAEQLLWARPGGVLGAPNPSIDCHFWQFETHTWHMNTTYKSGRQLLMEQVEEKAYEEANVDPLFWAGDRLEKQEQLEEKARLRAMVHSAGRSFLLKKQRSLIDDIYNNNESDVPGRKLVPSHAIFNNDKAVEGEGAKLLLKDPTKFFVFPHTTVDDILNESQEYKDEQYDGHSRGAPIALRDFLRERSHLNNIFPVFVAKLPKPDMMTERERKQQERQDRMLEAAAAASASENDGIDLGADRTIGELLEPNISYDDIDFDSDDEQWKEDLDEVTDVAIINTPPEYRFSVEDIDWVLEKLDKKIDFLENQFHYEVVNMKQKIQSTFLNENVDSNTSPSAFSDIQDILLGMTEDELIALSDLDDRYLQGISDDELNRTIEEDIPSLSKEQTLLLLTRDRSL